MNFEDIMVSEISQSQKDKYCIITLLKKFLFIYLFLAALGLRCCMQSFFSCSEWGLLPIHEAINESTLGAQVIPPRVLSLIASWIGSFVNTIFYYKFIYLFIFGCVGSSLLRTGFSLVAVSGGYSSLRCAGFSLWWLLLLCSRGSRRVGFSSCGMWAQ